MQKRPESQVTKAVEIQPYSTRKRVPTTPGLIEQGLTKRKTTAHQASRMFERTMDEC